MPSASFEDTMRFNQYHDVSVASAMSQLGSRELQFISLSPLPQPVFLLTHSELDMPGRSYDWGDGVLLCCE